MAPRALLILFVLFQTLFSTSSESCERLKASLSYTQEQAPRDLSGVVRCAILVSLSRNAQPVVSPTGNTYLCLTFFIITTFCPPVLINL
jgi:hypothetical protein